MEHATSRGGDLEDPEYRRQRLQEKKQQLQALRKQREEQQRKLTDLQQQQERLTQDKSGEKEGQHASDEPTSGGNQGSLDSYIESLLEAPVPGQKEDQKEKLIDEALRRLTLVSSAVNIWSYKDRSVTESSVTIPRATRKPLPVSHQFLAIIMNVPYKRKQMIYRMRMTTYTLNL